MIALRFGESYTSLMVARPEADRRFETYRFTFEQTGPLLNAQQLPRTIDEMTVGDVARALIDPSLGLICHEDVLENVSGEGFWDGVQRLRMLETEFRNIQRTIQTRGIASTSLMVGICFGRKSKASVDVGRLLYLRFGPIVADVALMASAAPTVLVCLVRAWQQAGLAEPGRSIFVPAKVGAGQIAEIERLYLKLTDVDVIGPSTAASLNQLTRAIGAPVLRSIERVPDSPGNAP
ncbi:MAG: hypothetical protein P4L46_02605 [Fimbriimonas sp.]|nr:hypothetical protein [Fimbriimonas sp.]